MAEAQLRIALIEPVGGHGGMDYYDYGLAQGLGQNNVQVFLFTSPETKHREYNNVTTVFTFRKVWKTKKKIPRFIYFFLGYFNSFKEARKKNIEIVHFQFFDLNILNLLVVVFSRFFSFKKVLTLHDVSSFKSKDVSIVEKLILNQFKVIIVHNETSYKELAEKVEKKDVEKISVIPHGNYFSFIQELPYQPSIGNELNLLFFGQIKKVKGLKVLLEAMRLTLKSNQNISLTIAGKPWHDKVDKYEDLIKEKGLDSHVTSHFKYIPDDAVSDYFKKADIVVLPYKKIYQSGVLLLTMSYGRVALTSDLPAFMEIVKDGETGLLFKKENPSDLSEVILEAAKDKKELLEIKKNASALLKEDFSWLGIGTRTKHLYEQL